MSQRSDALSITSLDRPTPTVTVEPDNSVFIGETVILKCDMDHQNDWIFRWFTQIVNPNDYGYYERLHFSSWYQYLKASEFEGNTLTIKEVATFQQNMYECHGQRKTRSLSSEFSKTVILTVQSLPTATLSIEPSRSVFAGESIILKCEIDAYGDWMFKWYKNWSPNVVFESEGNTFTITAATGSDQGQYWCQGERRDRPTISETSSKVMLDVKGSVPKLTSNPGDLLLTGDSVTLRCELSVSSGLVFYWYRDTQTSDPVKIQTDGNSYDISSVKVSDGGQYWCRAQRNNIVFYTPYSNGVLVNVTDKPKASIILKSKWTEFFRGENVSLRCEIQGGGDSNWNYSWHKNGLTGPSLSSAQEFTFTPEQVTGVTNYACKGMHQKYPHLFSTSESVSIRALSEPPQAHLRINSSSWLTEGDSVTLSCEISDSTVGWRFHWYRMMPHGDTQAFSDMCKEQRHCAHELTLDSSREAGSYTLSPAALRHSGVYICRAERGEPAYFTEFSQVQPLWVTALAPPASLIITPNRIQHFSSESLLMSCAVQDNSFGWEVVWFRPREKKRDFIPAWEMKMSGLDRPSKCSTVKDNACTLLSLNKDHSGVYWCQDQSGNMSNPVNITVQEHDVILESPAHPVLEGNSLRMHCIHRNRPLLYKGNFYKHSLPLNQMSDGEMTIHSVSKEHEGLYKCQRSFGAESPVTWIAVRASRPSGMVAVGIGVGLGLAFILSILFILLCWFKQLKEFKFSSTLPGHQQQSLTHGQIQSTQRDGNQSEYIPLKRGTADVYDTIPAGHVPEQRDHS